MTIPVFFSDALVADSRSYSPSAAKPAAVVRAWVSAGFPLEVVPPPALSVADLALAHDRAFVEGVLACETFNGFLNRSAAVARSLPFTSGAMFAAAERALKTRRVAVAPVSGFHHARWNQPVGFCTFNGLVVAVRLLQTRGLARRIGILDYDCHYGDGTAQILRHCRIRGVMHRSFGKRAVCPESARREVERIPSILRAMARAGCEVVLYQAGADPHVDDPLGGLLTSEELARRDHLVFQTAKELGLPIAWNLAGGYQTAPAADFDASIRPVVTLHETTMRICVETYEPTGCA
jgi:acetoin utilization deacetylase AcuC-like enzyme